MSQPPRAPHDRAAAVPLTTDGDYMVTMTALMVAEPQRSQGGGCVKPNELADGASQGASDSGLATVAEAPGADQQGAWLGWAPR